MKSACNVELPFSEPMKLVNQVCPVEFACVAGVPSWMALLLNDGHSETAVATGMLDCVLLSGSLKPST